MIYRPSRTSARVVRRLRSLGLDLPLDECNYCLHVSREAIGHNIAAGMDYPTWTLHEWDWSPGARHHPLASIREGGEDVEVEIGSPTGANALLRLPLWELEREGNIIRVHGGK